MKIKLTTVREIPEEAYYFWIDALRGGLPWIDADQLLVDKHQDYSSSESVQGMLVTATTRIEIEHENN
jgi:hypothetical protein